MNSEQCLFLEQVAFALKQYSIHIIYINRCTLYNINTCIKISRCRFVSAYQIIDVFCIISSKYVVVKMSLCGVGCTIISTYENVDAFLSVYKRLLIKIHQ